MTESSEPHTQPAPGPPRPGYYWAEMPDDGSVSIRVPDSMTYEEAQKVLALVEQMQATLRRLAQAEQDKVRLSALQADLLNTITEGSS